MTVSHPPLHGARILQFPLGGRASVGPRRQVSKPLEPRAPDMVPTEAGSGWYHDAAIEDAARGHDRH